MLLTITNACTLPHRTPTWCLLGALVCASAAAASAQQYTPPPPRLTTAPCVPTKKDPCDPPSPAVAPPASEKFQFPGDAPTPASPATSPDAKSFPFPGEAPATPAPPATTATPGKFAFPEDADPPSAPAGASSSSSSSGTGSTNADSDAPERDSEKPALADKGSSGSTRAERRNRPPNPQTPEQRESEDLDISHYYATTGNYKASYLRAQDAVKTIPEDPMAHFALAEAAKNLKQTTEAVAEYRLYLKLDPDGENVKQANRALSELAPR